MAYTGFFVFGDSLVDSGNALKLAKWYDGLPLTDLPDGAPTASLGYFQGRFSNGYTFADLLSNKTIGVVTKPVFPFGFNDPWLGAPIDPFASDPAGNNLNFAYGGSQIRQGSEVVPDLDGQTDAFKDAVDNHANSSALYLVTMGGNDVRSLAKAGSAPASQSNAYSALNKCSDQLQHELEQLISTGVKNIMITGIPDVGLIPDYDLNGNKLLDAGEIASSRAATQYSQYLDTLIRTKVVPALQAKGATVFYVPLMDYTDANGVHVTGALSAVLPTIAALHGLTTDQLSHNMLQYQNLVFFDQIHPNAQTQALFAAYSYAQITGTPWIETMPLAGADVDYKIATTVGAAGEVDKLSFSLVAGTTYRFEMLGTSSLGTPGTVGDPNLTLVRSGGTQLATDADSGVGLDALLTFTPSANGTYTVQLSAAGMLTGAYTAQAAVVSGAAMLVGNTYVVSSASTLVLEGAGGVGQDVVLASVSYALAAGSEIEALRTTNHSGTTTINLTGNAFAQTIVGNAGANIIAGNGGGDTLYGMNGNDTFVMSTSALVPGAHLDRIADYSSGDVVDVGEVLKVASGTDVISGGYLRVTTSGLIQIDLDGGANHWLTLGTINGTSAVDVRYLSGGVATMLSVARTADATTTSMSAMHSFAEVPAGSAEVVQPSNDVRGHWAAHLLAFDDMHHGFSALPSYLHDLTPFA